MWQTGLPKEFSLSLHILEQIYIQRERKGGHDKEDFKIQIVTFGLVSKTRTNIGADKWMYIIMTRMHRRGVFLQQFSYKV